MIAAAAAKQQNIVKHNHHSWSVVKEYLHMRSLKKGGGVTASCLGCPIERRCWGKRGGLAEVARRVDFPVATGACTQNGFSRCN